MKSPSFAAGFVCVAAILVCTAGMGWYAYRAPQDTLQGEAEVSEYRVSSKVPARVERICVSEGQRVHAGDTLCLLSAPDVQAKLSQAQAAERAAQAQRRKAERGTREEQVRAAREMWEKARVAVDVSAKSLTRVRNLCQQGVMTQQKLDEVQAQHDAALATERAARAQYDMALHGAQQEDKDMALQAEDRARGAVSEVRSYVAETVLLAPQDGEVTDIFPCEGELVGTGAPIMNVARMDDLWVTVSVREDRLAQFRVGGTMRVRIPALGDKQCDLRVFQMKDLGSYAAWRATKPTGEYDMKTFEVKARPARPISGLRAGMSVIVVEK